MDNGNGMASISALFVDIENLIENPLSAAGVERRWTRY